MRPEKKILIIFWFLLCHYYLKKRKLHKRWRNRKWHTRPINKLRKQLGHYDVLFQELKKDENMFFQYVKMSKHSFQTLLQLLQSSLIKHNYRALPPEQRLLIALRFIGTGDQTASIALDFRVGESTVRKLYKEVYSVITTILLPLYLSPPTEQQWACIATNYWKKWHMPNCLGAIDGKHIVLKCPPNSGSSYFNYKKQHSIVLMAVADYRYKFTLVDVGGYGGNSDGGIFADSEIGLCLTNDDLNLPKGMATLPGSDIATPAFFVADDDFSLSNRIMKPYSGKQLANKKKIFNYRISRARQTIESAFGIYSNKWNIFHKALCMLPKTADIVVTSCACLHNFILTEEERSGEKVYSTEFYNTEHDNVQWSNEEHLQSLNTRAGLIQRDALCDYFITPNGEVTWQYDYITRGLYGEYRK